MRDNRRDKRSDCKSDGNCANSAEALIKFGN